MTRTTSPGYKPSGIEWLGDIPQSWRVAEVKHTHRVTLGKMLQSEAKESSDVGLPYLRAAHIPPTGFTLNDPKEMWFSKAEVAELTLKKGDVVVVEGGMGGYGRCDIVPEDVPNWGFQNSINRLRPVDGNCGAYTKYLLQIAREKGFIDVLCSVSTMPHLTAEKLAAIRLPLPQPDEQWAIADFLDRETAKIDALIGKQEQLIATLREDRTATITHAVTKGIDPGVELKDSGVEWICGLPDQWIATPLKYACMVLDCKHLTAEFVDEGYPLASIREVQSRYVDLTQAKRTTGEYYKQLSEGGRSPRLGDLIFSRNATVGEAAQVAPQSEPFAMGQDVCLLRPVPAKLSPDYAWYVLRSKLVGTQVELAMVGSTFKRINVEKIKALTITCPPREEQEAIVQFLDERCGRINTLISTANVLVETLREYRSALITDAVTGKIDARGAA